MPNEEYSHIQEQQLALLLEAERKCTTLYGPEVINSHRPPIYNETTKRWMCPAYWDTIYCWPNTQANTTAIVGCPSYFTGFIETNNATRACNSDGNWFSVANKTWTNYTKCASGDTTTVFFELKFENVTKILQEHFPTIKMISQTGYAVSLVSLLIAFTIMFSIKKLHCARNILHMNLFASFILRAFMSLLKDILFYRGIGTDDDIIIKNGLYFHTDVQTNNYQCKLLTTLVHYFTTANYSWILMEGLYLNNLIFRALFADSSKNIMHYVILGWGLPLLVIMSWVVARLMFDDSYCWTMNTNQYLYLIIAIPIQISVVINFVLFVIISIVLYSKLRSPINEDSRRYQKWAKSTLVLVPLFGVHYSVLLILYFIGKTNVMVESVWLICDLLFGSFQGFFVAVLYCFLNGEVRAELKPYIYSFLTYFATHKYLRHCLPCREKYLRSAVGRTSVCTTMSCSSLYTNGIMHHRNSRSKLGDVFPKNKHNSTQSDKNKDHICANGTKNSHRGSQNSLHFHNKQSTTGSIGTAETTLIIEPRQEKSVPEPIIIEEEISMLTKNY